MLQWESKRELKKGLLLAGSLVQRSSVSLTWEGSGSTQLLFNNNQTCFKVGNYFLIIMIFDNTEESAQFIDVPCNRCVQPVQPKEWNLYGMSCRSCLQLHVSKPISLGANCAGRSLLESPSSDP
jgi:hypothetical protein